MGQQARRRPTRCALLASRLAGLIILSPALLSAVAPSDSFDEDHLNQARWTRIGAGDNTRRVIGILAAREQAPHERCLGIGIDTRETKNDTVKVAGVRSIPKFALVNGTRISTVLQWLEQKNASYFKAQILLSPYPVSGNPLLTPDWLGVAYVGVPPRENARLVVETRVNQQERTLYREGWPLVNRAGRPISAQQIEIRFRSDGFDLLENDTVIFQSQARPPFREAYLYLLVTSHSNFPLRLVCFDDIEIRAPP